MPFSALTWCPGPGFRRSWVPTTAGTGKDHPGAILSDTRENLKKALSAHLFPEVALLDPALTIGLPQAVTAFTGLDALIHAIEAYTSVQCQ
jgi:alcohol dehydrogenase class IV